MLSYWKAEKGGLERVYLNVDANRRLYGQKISGDRVAWRGDGIDQQIAEGLARQRFGTLPTWTRLKQLAHATDRAPLGSRTTTAHASAAKHLDAPAITKPVRNQERAQVKPDTPYTGRDAQKLNVYDIGPMPAPTRVVVDPREPREIAKILARIENVEVVVASPTAGRYCVEGCLAIDRVSALDLQKAMLDDPRGLEARTAALSEMDHAVLLIVEGGLRSQRRVPLNELDGALSYMSVAKRIPVVDTLDVWETVYLIVRAIRYACHGSDGPRELWAHRREGRKEQRVNAHYVLEGIPGVSEVRSSALMSRFGDLRGIALASYQELVEVPGVGRTTAQAVYDTFRSPA